MLNFRACYSVLGNLTLCILIFNRFYMQDEEVVMLQEQVSLLQHQMGLDRPSHHVLIEEASSGSRPGAVGASSSLRADDSGSGFSTSVSRDGVEAVDVEKLSRSSKGMAGTTNVTGHASVSNGNGIPAGGAGSIDDFNRKWHLANAGIAGDKHSSGHGGNSAKAEVKAPAPIKTRSMDGSRPPRIIPAASGSMASGMDETSSSYSGTLSATSPGITRPTSAPGLVASQRPGNVGPILHAQPPLSRSLSAAGRLVLGADSSLGAHSNGNIDISPPVSPSYRNAAAGKIKSSGILASFAVSSSVSVHGGLSASMSGVASSAAFLNPAAMPSSSHVGVPSAYLSAPTASAASPPSTPSSKVQAGSLQGTHSAKTEASPSSTPVPSQPPVVSQGFPEVLPNSLPVQETNTSSSSQGGAGGRRSPVGITFGTVTPEVLHQQQEEEQEHLPRHQKDEPAQPPFPSLPPQHQESVEIRKQENLVFQDGLSRHLSHGQQAYQRSVHPSLLHENGVLSAGRHSMMSLMESVNNGGAMGEEFPHLDIINDLLEDDQGCFGMALNSMVQQSGSAPFSTRHLSMPSHSGMLKHNQYGQLHSDGNAGNNDASDRGRTSDDERMHMHEGNHVNMRDNRRIPVGFSHQPPLGRLQSQHSGHLDSMASHYWPITSAGIPAANHVRNGLDTHMGYPLVQSHHVQDCSGFTLGNGYSVYAPAQQP